MLDLGGFGSLRRGEREEEEEDPQEDGAAVEVGGGTAGGGVQPGGGWTVVTDEASGDTYYWNTVTGETTWEKPKELAGWDEEGKEEAAGDVALHADANTEQKKVVVRDDTGAGESALLGLSGYGSESGGEDEERTKDGEEKEEKVTEEEKVEFKAPKPVKMQLKPKQATVSKVPVSNVFSKAKKTAADKEHPKEDEHSSAAAGGAEGSPAGGGEDVDEFMRELEAARTAVSAPGPAQSQSKGIVLAADSNGIMIPEGSSQGGKSTVDGNYDPCDADSEDDDDVNEFLKELEKPGGKKRCPKCGRAKEDGKGHDEAEGEDDDEGRWLAVCGEMVLELRQKGDVIVERLRAATGEEEIIMGGRRDRLLSLLGAADSLNESIVELGALVVDKQSESFSQQIAVYLPNLRARMTVLENSVDALLEARSDDHIEVLPKGWVKVTTTDEGRVMYVHQDDGLVQTHPPPGTVLETVAQRIIEKARDAEAAKVKAADKAAEHEEGEVDEIAAEATTEPKPDEIEKMRQALPPADGKSSLDSMLVYFHPSPECTVPRIRQLFVDRRIFMIRSIGSGFAAVTFCDSLECELARWQALAAISGGKASQSGSVKDWVVFSTAPVLAFGRAATDKDAISRYPVIFAGAPPPNTVTSIIPPTPSSIRTDPAPSSAFTQPSHHSARSLSPYEQHSSGHASPFELALVGDDSRTGAVQQGAVVNMGEGLVGGLAGMMGAGTAGKVEKVKTSGKAKLASSKFAKQMEVWKSKRSELQDQQEEEDGAMTLEKLEREREKKANQWFQDQVMSGAVGDDNPNFIPVQKMFTPY